MSRSHQTTPIGGPVSFMAEIQVGISGINATDNPGPGIGVARSLKEDAGLDVEIVGLAYDAMEPGIYINWLIDKSFILPYPSKGGEDFIERLLYVRDAFGLEWVIPNLDAELPLYIKYAKQLSDQGIRTVLPDMDQFRLRGKDKLAEVAEQLDINMPQTEAVGSERALSDALDRIGFPVMLKGVFYQAYHANNALEAAGYYRKLVAEWGYPVIVQRVVVGDELNVVGVGDGKGSTLGMVGIKKTSVTTLGKVWSALTVKNNAMLEAAQSFVRQAQWNGPFEMECIANRDGVNLIEINPRFPAWVYFATGVGVNLPARMLRHFLGMDVETTSDYAAGKLFMRYTDELVTDMALFQSVMTQGES